MVYLYNCKNANLVLVGILALFPIISSSVSIVGSIFLFAYFFHLNRKALRNIRLHGSVGASKSKDDPPEKEINGETIQAIEHEENDRRRDEIGKDDGSISFFRPFGFASLIRTSMLWLNLGNILVCILLIASNILKRIVPVFIVYERSRSIGNSTSLAEGLESLALAHQTKYYDYTCADKSQYSILVFFGELTSSISSSFLIFETVFGLSISTAMYHLVSKSNHELDDTIVNSTSDSDILKRNPSLVRDENRKYSSSSKIYCCCIPFKVSAKTFARTLYAVFFVTALLFSKLSLRMGMESVEYYL